MVRVSVLLCCLPLLLMSAVPDDISSNQRAWYDAVDIDADGDYTDNPMASSVIGTWKDKSAQNNDVSSTGTSRPTYRTSNPLTSRNGVDFDGSNDFLKDNDDIWNGSVSHSEIFIVAKVDNYTSQFLFSSMTSHNHRLSVHLPWSNGISYFDHGQCCGDPARLSGNIPITIADAYFWHLIAEGNSYQAVLQDAKVRLSDNNGVGVYNANGGTFSLAKNTYDSYSNYFSGKIYEAIFYQQNLNDAQRRIMNAYLSAKWDKAFAPSPTYGDVYNGDDNGYDFFVGGIGREADGSQLLGTSQGLSITNNDFLANGKYVLAGVNYLTTTPQTGTEPTGTLNDANTTASYEYRASRLWYIDNTGTGGTVKLSFDANRIGIPVNNNSTYGLLCRNGTIGNFLEVAVSSMSGGVVSFDYLPTDDVCTIGKKLDTTLMRVEKISCVIADGLNVNSNAKRIPGASIRFAIEVKNEGNFTATNVLVSDSLGSNFDVTSIQNLQIQSGVCDCLGVSSASNNGVNGSVNGENPIVLDFGDVLGGSMAITAECGYFEVDLL